MKHLLALLSLLVVSLAAIGLSRAGDTEQEKKEGAPRRQPKKDETLSDKGFVSIFDGKTLKGWHVSAQSGHSKKSENKSGGRWVVEDGAIVGSQDILGNGGIVITDAEYGDFEVALEMKSDFGPDSGLFLRCNDKGQCYQAMIDYHKGGNLMGFYGEALKPGFHVYNFTFGDEVTKITEDKNKYFTLPIEPEDWPTFWKADEWNEVRARIIGNPAKMVSWIKGVRWFEYEDTVKRADKDKGGIALQVHGGNMGYTDRFVRYRNIRVKVLDKEN
jgi:hypothetical protein